MKKNLYITVIFYFVISNVFSQDTINGIFEENETLMSKGEWHKSIIESRKLLQAKPNWASYNFKCGYSYFNAPGKRDSAMQYFAKAALNVSVSYTNLYNDSTAPVETWYFLARIYHLNYMFDEAIEEYKKYIQYALPGKKVTDSEQGIKQCEYGKELITRPIDLAVMELGGDINTIFDEHSPVITADLKTLIFTSKREGSTGEGITEDGNYYEDIYISHFENGRWSNPIGISENINTDDHEASVGLSADGRILYIYRDENEGDIFVSFFKDGKWSKPSSVGKNINSQYRETHATISADEKTLYFSSNRPGGYGGLDIYYCKKEGLSWGKSINMGPSINTNFDEEGPFIHHNDSTLFFSSNGHLGIGGFDLFTSFLNEEGTWSKPENLGYPANSTGDDIYYVSSPGGNFGFYVSNQQGTGGGKNLYSMMLADKYRKMVSVLSGKIDLSHGFDELPDDKNIKITIIDPVTKDTLRVYETDKTGDFMITLPTDRKYIVFYEAENQLIHSQEIMIEEEAEYQTAKRIIPLQPIIRGAANESYGIQFLTGTDTITYESQIRLARTTEDLNNYEDLQGKIFVPEVDELKSERTNSIVDFLISQKVDTSKVHIVKSKQSYFEFLVADTMFLRYLDRDWTVKYDDCLTDPEIISKHKLKELQYFIKRNPELYIEVPVIEKSTSKVYFDKLWYLHHLFSENGIDTSRVIAVEIPDDETSDKCSVNIKVRSKRNHKELLITVLTRRQYGDDGLMVVPVMIHDISFISLNQAQYIKSYLNYCKLDTTGVQLRVFKAGDTDYNELRKNLTNERYTGTLITSSLYENTSEKGYVEILPGMMEKEGSERYFSTLTELDEKEMMAKKHKEKKVYVNNEYNALSMNIRLDKTDGLVLKEFRLELGDLVLTKSDCEYLFKNLNQTFFLVNFDFDKHVTNKTGGLDSVSTCLKQHPGVKVSVDGHTDSKGTNEYNVRLSQRRADFVKSYMLQRGVKSNQLDESWHSENNPVAPNEVNGEDFGLGRAKNRRVELKVVYIDSNIEKI